VVMPDETGGVMVSMNSALEGGNNGRSGLPFCVHPCSGAQQHPARSAT
jgi:hypothetical protein